MWFRLVRRNLTGDRSRLIAATAGVMLATVLIGFETGLLVGFAHAASRVIDRVDADVWMMRRSIPAFDFGFGVTRDLKYFVLSAPHVTSADEVVVGWSTYSGPDGQSNSVQLVGVGPQLKHQITPATGEFQKASQFHTDGSYQVRLGVGKGSRAQLGDLELESGQPISGFSSFLGPPFVYAELMTSRRTLNLPHGLTSFIAIKVADASLVPVAIKELQSRYPELEVLSASGFSWRTRMYWLVETGAGGSLVLCALLGFVIGLAIVSQTIFGLTMDRIDEFATLKALGTPAKMIFRMVFVQALMCTALGALVGIVVLYGVVSLAQMMIPWCELPLWLVIALPFALVPMSLFAAWFAARPAVRLDPAKAFRA